MIPFGGGPPDAPPACHSTAPRIPRSRNRFTVTPIGRFGALLVRRRLGGAAERATELVSVARPNQLSLFRAHPKLQAQPPQGTRTRRTAGALWLPARSKATTLTVCVPGSGLPTCTGASVASFPRLTGTLPSSEMS